MTDDDDEIPETDADDPFDDALALLPGNAPSRRGARRDRSREVANGIQLVKWRALGMTYEQIAEQAGYSDPATARHALMRALDRHEAENVAQLRTLENIAYDSDQRALRSIISDPETKPDIRIAAINARTRSAARHARLNGLDAPVRLAVTSPTQLELMQAMEEFREVVLGEVVDAESSTG